MATKELRTKILLLNGTNEDWSKLQSYVLSQGEPAIEYVLDGENKLQSVKLKIGGANIPYSDLPYVGEEYYTQAVSDFTAALGEVREDVNSNTSAISGLTIAVGTPEDQETGAEATGLYKLIKEISVEYDDTELRSRIEGVEGELATTKSLTQTLQGDLSSLQSTSATKAEVEAAKGSLIGTADDTETADTIKGAKAYADKKINDLLAAYIEGDGGDEVINTLNEVAAWINNDEAGVVQLTTDVADTKAALANKVDKVEGYGLLSDEDKAKLDKLTFDGDNLEISGNVNASQVQGLDDAIATWVNGELGNGQAGSAKSLLNKIQEDIDKLNTDIAGIGTSEVDVNRLYIPEGDTLVLNGGSASNLTE